jgi:predicted CDP-diglyceride synthetase/phosphatidate cytidylyltransferase
MNLKEYGFDISLLAAGLFGALLMTSRTSSQNAGKTLVALVGGSMSANYLTPVVVQLTKIESVQMEHAIAFLLGFCGLKAVEAAAQYLMKVPNDFEQPTHTRKRSR